MILTEETIRPSCIIISERKHHTVVQNIHTCSLDDRPRTPPTSPPPPLPLLVLLLLHLWLSRLLLPVTAVVLLHTWRRVCRCICHNELSTTMKKEETTATTNNIVISYSDSTGCGQCNNATQHRTLTCSRGNTPPMAPPATGLFSSMASPSSSYSQSATSPPLLRHLCKMSEA